MLEANEQRSEVARLSRKLAPSTESGQNALHGLAYGASRHDFITARMESMGQLHAQLQKLVGENVAMAMITDQLNHVKE